MSYQDLGELLDRYGWEQDGHTTEGNRFQYALTPVKGRRSTSRRGGWHEWQGGNIRWRLPGTDIRCSVLKTHMVRVYDIGYRLPRTLRSIRITNIAGVKAVLDYLLPQENVPILSGDEWDDLMEAIAKHAKDATEAKRITELLRKRDWLSFFQARDYTDTNDEEQVSTL